MIMAKLQITAPGTPGATPRVQGTYDTMAAAREDARRRFFDRRDLRGSDVRIEFLDGRLVEYAGPSR